MTRYQKILGALAIAGALSTSGVAFAQTATTTDITTTSVIAPDTGAGGEAAQNFAVLGGSALVLVAGAVYLGRKRNLA